MNDTNYESAIAIVGMSGRFPGAANVDELWRNLLAGKPGLRPLTEDELTAAGISPALLANPNYVRYGAPVADIDQFDAGMFGFSRREAETMDPQHRLFLECSWEAIESAGYAPNDAPGKVGVFAGSGFPDYMLNVADKLNSEPGGQLLLAVGNERDSLASMLSYKLDLRGPSVTVQTFCSTSLVATHLAAQSLLNYECDMAVAGGVYLSLPQHAGYLFEEGSITTPDGRIRSFDAAARGTVLGNGVAVVTLKRMTDALADGDPIHAVILGSAVNNDGRACAGYTAPGVDGQSEVVELALGVADVKSETVGYVECHMTGTQLGDSIELAALSRVFQNPPAVPTVLSTLKPSIGHLDRASGVAGLIRTTMALRDKVLPGTPGFETPNSTLAAAKDRFRVLTEPQPWAPADHPRRAGVSSFGFGGTNAHVVLEEAPPVPAAPARPGPHLLVLSARDLDALYGGIERLRAHLESHRDQDLADVAHTLQQSRASFLLRWAVVCHDHDDALAALADQSRWIIGEAPRPDGPVALRLCAPGTASDQRWREVAAALHRLVPPNEQVPNRSPAEESGDYAVGLTAADTLTRLGVRVASIVGDPGAEALAERLSADFGIAGQLADDEGMSAEFVLEPADDEPADEWLLTALALLWQAGTRLDWAGLHPGTPRRVTLPTYPFQRKRYWVERPKNSAQPVESTERTGDVGRWTHLASWRQRHVPFGDLAERARAAGPWLLFGAEAGADTVADLLTEYGADVTVVRPGAAFGQLDDGSFVVRPDSAEDLDQVFAAQVFAPRTVVHGFALAPLGAETDPVRRFDDAQPHGFHSALALADALERAGGDDPIELVLLTDGAVEVAGGDLRCPEHATLSGLAPVLAQENPVLTCRHVDLDASRGDLDRLARQIVAESVTEHAGPVAWRGNRRWLRAYEAQPLPAPDLAASPLLAGSTVLVTGGLGNVGLLLARHLATTRGCKLVLTTRSALPPRAEWADRVAAATPGDKIARYLQRVLDLEVAGAQVLAMSADIADGDRMAEVVAAAEERFGGIDAVVHAAGVQDSAFFGVAHTMDRAACDAHLRAKVHGFLHLQRLLADKVSGPRITLSSLSAILGGLTYGPYAASNAALDAYVLAARDENAGRWVSVDWDAWQNPAATIPVAGFEMAPDEGIEVFERALAAVDEIGRLVISTGSLGARHDQWVVRAGAADAADAADDRPVEPRPALAQPYIEPANPLERTLAEIWATVLRLDRVGVEDDFYRLGGDSIVSIDLIARIRKALKVAIPVTALLEEATVRKLAGRVAALTDA
ncbi:SDR family NAD(P)-dependent oxidoreductase [Actinokineospora sp.]|uniref:SDR family NAD(P)-dependent oxidoreductase n=1 Tax=Actinokineospora sp. TaxID=1872133 RepID=UPI0040381983